MPTVIDSLFLELGIDTSKFSADQQRALAKIAEFEKRSKKGAKGAAQSVKTVGEAFRDIADDSVIGGATKRLDSFSVKLKALGQAGQVSGGLGTPLGRMAEGLGALLSPVALGTAALGMLGIAAWDLNEKMTATNATIFRQSQLTGMSAKNLFAYGQMARAVGAQPGDITGGISSLQTAITGMGIGADNATPQLVALARLGLGNAFNFRTGVDVRQLFERVHQMAVTRGFKNLGSLRALTMPLMNDAMFNVAVNPTFDPARFQQSIKAMEPPNFEKTLKESLESQTLLGKLDIRKTMLAETAYGGIQKPMQTLVGLMTNLLAVVSTLLSWTIKIAGWVGGIAEHFGIKPISEAAAAIERYLLGKSATAAVGGVPVAGKLPSNFTARQAMAMKALMGRGISQSDAAALIGNASQESTLEPTITTDNGAHIGLFQLNRKRQADFAAQLGYRIGSKDVPKRQQFLDQLVFAQIELGTSQKRAAAKMAQAADLYGKTRAFQDYDERPGADDHTFGRRLLYAESAFELGMGYAQMLAAANARRGVIDRSVTHHTRIGTVAVHTQATDAKGMAAGARKALSAHPLIAPAGQHQATLSTRGMTG